MGTINIVLAVDVIAALSNQSLEGSLHMMDDGPARRKTRERRISPPIAGPDGRSTGQCGR